MAPRLQKQRARSADDKLARREGILDTACALITERPLSAITMAEVARNAKLAKGTLYLYFPTKEALLLAAYERDLETIFRELGFELLERPLDGIDDLAQRMSDGLERHPVYRRLAIVLHTILEQNIDLETAIAFKRKLLAHLEVAGRVIETQLSFLQPGQGAQLFLRAHALLIGIHQLAEPAPIAAEALETPGLEVFQIDFATEFIDTLVSLLRGMERRANEQQH